MFNSVCGEQQPHPARHEAGTEKTRAPNIQRPPGHGTPRRTTAGTTAASTQKRAEESPEECFSTIGQEELNKLITTSKPTTCLLDPVPTKLLKELPVAEEPLLNIINSSLSLGHVPKTIQAGSY